MVERFNGRIADILRTHHFQSGKELEHTIMRYVDLYNNHLPQANLNCRTPCQVMYEWYENKPQFFDKAVHNRPEGDIYQPSFKIISNFIKSPDCCHNIFSNAQLVMFLGLWGELQSLTFANKNV